MFACFRPRTSFLAALCTVAVFCLAMARTDQLKAAVIGAGLFDSHRMIKDRLEMETEVMARFGGVLLVTAVAVTLWRAIGRGGAWDSERTGGKRCSTLRGSAGKSFV